MMGLFRKISSHSVKDAKNRLKSVIKNDRINVTQSKTLEKMKKEVSAVLLNYSLNSKEPPRVSVTCENGTLLVLRAYVPIKEENYIG